MLYYMAPTQLIEECIVDKVKIRTDRRVTEPSGTCYVNYEEFLHFLDSCKSIRTNYYWGVHVCSFGAIENIE